MASVFLRNPDGVIVEQPSEVLAYFLARDWEVVGDPAITDAAAAASEAARVAELLKAEAESAADVAAAAAEHAEDVKADAADFAGDDEDVLPDSDETADSDDSDVLTTGLGENQN